MSHEGKRHGKKMRTTRQQDKRKGFCNDVKGAREERRQIWEKNATQWPGWVENCHHSGQEEGRAAMAMAKKPRLNA